MNRTVEYTETVSPERKKLRKKARRKQIAMRFVTFLMVCVVGVYCAVGWYGLQYAQKLLKGMPELDVSDMISEESSRIYDGNGRLITEIGTYYRENVSYDQCPESLIDAFLSVEDSRFFEHNGFDIPRFTKAAIETLLLHRQQGGSTFTMQLVKNTYFTIDAGDESVEREATLEYKAQQIVLAMEAELNLSKREIFELYINKLNFGGLIRGAEKAAEYYFGKTCNELTLPESAMLAGLINLPNLYNPYEYLENATERRNDVLDQMYNHGYINYDEWALARSVKIENTLVGEDKLNVSGSMYGAYVDAVIEEAMKMTGYDPVMVGMEIHTALVPEVQQEIERIQNDQAGIPYNDDLMQCAIISVNNHTGEIIGLGGGRHYQGGARLLNRVTAAYHQPGSSVKPFLSYALGFEYLGYSLDEILIDRPITYPGESRQLYNAGTDRYEGDIPIKTAVAASKNIPAILTLEKVVDKTDSDTVVKYLKSMNVAKADYDTFHFSYAIGSNEFEMTVKELAGCHAAMINLGVYNEPHCITKIERSNGELYYPENQNVRVLSSGSAWLVDQLMKYNVDISWQMGNYMQPVQRNEYPVYAKTGTSDWGDSGLPYGIPYGASKDKWLAASTSQYTNVVWVGYDMALAWQNTYIDDWTYQQNLPGRILSLVLDAEYNIAPEGSLNGVSRPADVQDVTYVNGTYPHVQAEGWMPAYAFITSQISSTGLKNSPLIASSDYGNETPHLDSISASISGNYLNINWGSSTGCTGGVRDISLHDGTNNVNMTGRCLVDTSWLARGNGSSYYATVYVNGYAQTTISSTTGSYSGVPGIPNGSVRVCAWYSNAKGTSETVCSDVGNYSYKAPKPSKPSKDTDDDEGSSEEETAEEETSEEEVPEEEIPEE